MKDWLVKYWLETIFATITSGVLLSFKKFKAKRKKEIEEQKIKEDLKDREIQVLKLGVQALLRNEIQRSCYECFNKKFCTFEELDNIDNMYQQYHALGGNGTVTELFKKLKNLKIRKEGDFDD